MKKFSLDDLKKLSSVEDLIDAGAIRHIGNPYDIFVIRTQVYC